MTELTTILQLILLSLWCHGWYYLFQPGEALYFLSKWAYKIHDKGKSDKEIGERKIKSWYMNQQGSDEEYKTTLVDLYHEKMEENTIKFERKIYFLKPLFLCPICFASLYGTGGYLLLNYTIWGVFPVAIISLISVNRIFNKFL